MTSTGDDKVSTIKVIPFDPEDYKKWSRLVSSKAIAHKFGKVFFNKSFEDLNITPEEYYSEEATDAEGQTYALSKDDKEKFELNAKAWSYLEESVKDDPVAYGLLSVIENRNAHRGWKALKEKYDKTGDAIDMTSLENEWNDAKMSNDLEDPDIWFNELERIRGLIKEVAPAIHKNDTVMALKISSNLPHCYIPVYTNLTQVKKQGDLETVKETVRAHYKAFIKNKTPEELAFINYTPHQDRKKYQRRTRSRQNDKNKATEENKQVWCDYCKRDTHSTDQCYSKDPKCFNCGKAGHLKKDCRAKGGGAHIEQANAASKDVACLLCNKTGHKAADCPDKEKGNKKNVSFAGSAHIGEETTIEGSHDTWLLDSGASVHITNNKNGLYNIKRIKTDVVVGDGWTSTSSMKGELKLTTDEGYELHLKNVLYIPGFDKNLLSAMRLIENGNQIIFNSPSSGYIQQGDTQHRIQLTAGDHNMLYLNCIRLTPQKVANQATLIPPETPPTTGNINPFAAGIVSDDDESDDEEAEAPLPERRPTYRDALVGQSNRNKTLDVNDAHRKFGHCNPSEMKSLAKVLGLTLTGNLDPCPACLMAKSHQNKTRKKTINPKPEPGELLCFDLTGPFPPDIHQNKYMAVACDDATGHSWSKPMKTKSELKDFAQDLLENLFRKGVNVRRIRCDNASENKKHLTPLCKLHHITLELTAPHTPQYNGKVERCIVELWKSTQSILTAARLTQQPKNELWSYAWRYAEDSRSPTKRGDIFMGGQRQQRILSHPIEFGRIGIMDTGKKTKRSMSNRGERVIMIGYGGHTNSSDTYLLFKTRTRQIVVSRNVKWERWHGIGTSSAPLLTDHFDGVHEDQDTPIQNFSLADYRNELGDIDLESLISFEDGELLDMFEFSDDDESLWNDSESSDESIVRNNQDFEQTGNSGTSQNNSNKEASVSSSDESDTHMPRRGFSENRPAKIIDLDHPEVLEGRTRLQQRTIDESTTHTDQNRAHFIHSTASHGATLHRKRLKVETANNAISSDPGTPNSWKELWNTPELKKKWTDSVCSEIENFLRRDAWKLFPRKDLNGRKPISSKYVFKEKTELDGSTRLKTRIVIKGYTQIPGIDFTETFSPVANDASIRVALSYSLYKENWIPHVIDIEAAFLEADLEEDIVAEWPEGLKELGYTTDEIENEFCILLNKAMYGTVQAPRAFFLTFTKYLKEEMNLTQSKVDPCMWYKKRKGNTVLIMAIYVDDCILCGEDDEIEWCKTKIKDRFNISDLGKIKKHIGVHYEKGNDEHGPFYELSMDDYCNKFIEETERLCGNIKLANTPAFPGTVLPKASENDHPIKEPEYRCLIGTALYLIRKILPRAANAIRDLSQHLDKPQGTHWKSIMRLAGYLKKHIPRFYLRRPKRWQIIAYTDSNYATDSHDRKSVSGMIVTIGGSIVSWASKKQDIVALSTCEAEFIASTFCAQEILFVGQLMEEISPAEGIAIMYGDNNGAIFISKHSHVGQRTKHIDVRYHFIRELINEKKLEYRKIKSDENPSDILTKNVTEKCLETHEENMKSGCLFGCTTTEASSREDVEKVCARCVVVPTNGRKMMNVELPLDQSPTVTKCHTLSGSSDPGAELSKKHRAHEKVEEDPTENKGKADSVNPEEQDKDDDKEILIEDEWVADDQRQMGHCGEVCRESSIWKREEEDDDDDETALAI